MNDFLKYGLIGGGAWLLWRQFFAAAEAPAVASTTAATAATTAATVAAAAATTTQGLLMQAAQRAMGAGWNGLLTAHEWNYYYSQVRGVAGPDPGPLWADTNRRMSLDEYWPVMTQAGFSGLNYAAGRC